MEGSFRFRAEGRTAIGFQEGNDSGYSLTRFRVGLDVEPSPWFRLFLEAQDSRSPGLSAGTPALRDPFDLYQAFFELGRPKGGWRFRVGRQEMPYGVERLISRNDWRNTGRSFDAVKLMLGGEDFGVDVFAASEVRTDFGTFNKHRDGENLHGIYGRLNGLSKKTTIEPYLLYTTTPRVTDSKGFSGDEDRYSLGFRLVHELNENSVFHMEFARQLGSFAEDDISAWMGYWIWEQRLSRSAGEPRLFLEYSHAGGDSDPADGVDGTFDSLFLTGHRYYGFADLIGARNIRDLRLGLNVKPLRNMTLALDWHNYWLASRNDHLYAASLQIFVRVPPEGALSSKVGQELDLTLRYRLSSRITIGAGIGHLFPGPFLKQNSPGAGSSYPYLFWDQSF